MRLLRKLRTLFRKEQLDAEMAEEMRHHLDAQLRRNLAAGMSLEDAHHAARRSFGGVEQIKERARDQRGWMWLDHLRQDLRYGVRGAQRNPGFTAAAVLTLALGIGANTAAFTAINALVFNSLPVRAPEELVLVSRAGTAAGPAASSNRLFSFPLYERLRVDAPSVRALAALTYSNRTLLQPAAPGAEPESVRSGEVSGNFFSTVGARLRHGRPIDLSDDREQDPQAVVVLSHDYWARRFASDLSIIGQTVSLDDVPFTIVGVAAPGFTGVEVAGAMDLWLPLQVRRRFDPVGSGGAFRADGAEWLRLIGRVDAGVRREKAAAEMDVIYQRFVSELATRAGENWTKSPQRRVLEGRLELWPGRGGFNESIPILKPLLASISMVVLLVLLISCANVASLTLARAATREREFAVRLALGGGRGRLIRQVLTETVLFALVGGAAGVVFARWSLDLLVSSFFPPELIVTSGFRLSPDTRVILFTMAIAIATGVLVGLVPALRFSRLNLVSALKDSGHGTAGGGRQRFNQLLIVAQIAVSVCLLAGAGLFIRTVQNLRDTDLGFDRLKALRIVLPLEKNADLARRGAVVQEMLSGLAALPGVRHVTVAEGAVRTSGGDRVRIEVDGYLPAERENMTVPAAHIGPGFFENMAIPVLQGRAPDARETLTNTATTPGVMVISESAARKYFGEASPLGRRLRLAGQPAPLEVIGIARDVMFNGVRQKTPVVLYVPYGRALPRLGSLTFYVRTSGNPLAIAADARALIRRVAPTVSLRGPMLTVENWVDLQIFQERAIAQVATFFSGFALVLACVGLYGTLAYNVARRTREIGVRMALGARQSDVQRMIVRQGLGLALMGCLIGLGAAMALVRGVSRLLYGVSAADPATLLATAGVLVGVALLASWVPARRATQVNPMIALRAE